MKAGHRIVIISAAVLISVASACAVSFAQDAIKLKNGNVIKGSIIKTGKAGISFELAGEKAVIVVPLGNIDRLDIETPVSFRLAENSYFANSFEQAYENYMKTIEKYGGFSYGEDAFFKAADCQVKIGNAGRAIELYNEYIEDYPGAKSVNTARIRLASILVKDRDYEGAVKAYDAVIRSRDEGLRPDAYYGNAEAYFAKGAYEQALVNYLKVALLYYDKGRIAQEAKFKCGECYEKLGEREMALAAYRETMEEYPKSEAAVRAEAKIKELEKSGKKN
ncbi:MAG: tetratricopeptide repeat protein [Candidatus Omnitrophota bacterium]|jgi:TolA-binding protein